MKHTKQTDKAAYLAAVKADFGVFVRHSFRTLYPDTAFEDNWHIDALAYAFAQCIEGKCPRLIVNLPPRYLKSFLASVALPAYILGMDPSARVICVSYSEDLAKALARDAKRLMESPGYRAVFPDMRLAKNTETEIVTEAGGGRLATSVNGTLTGRGGDFIIVDDPIKPDEAYSDAVRTSTNDWYRNTLLSRLNDKMRSVLIIVMQRVHVGDLTGYVQDEGSFRKLSFPAIAIKDEQIPTGEKQYYERYAGEPLHAAREDLNTLEKLRHALSSMVFAAQYQQAPETPDGSLFKRRYFNTISAAPPIHPKGAWIVSIDSALSTSETADYSALTLVYTHNTIYYVMRAERGRWDYETLKAKANEYIKRYGKKLTFIVEQAGSGISLIQALHRARVQCFHHLPKNDKMSRAAHVLPLVEAGRVRILDNPNENAWVEGFINELVTFPQGRYDDQVDSLVQLLRWAERRYYPRASYLGQETPRGQPVTM